MDACFPRIERSSRHRKSLIQPYFSGNLANAGAGAIQHQKSNNAFKLYASLGASFLPDNSISTSMAFVGDKKDHGTVNVHTDGPSVLGRLNLGVQAAISDQLEIRAQYDLEAGSGYRNQGVSTNLVYRF